MNIENLKALVYGKETTPYQRALALSEFSKVVEALENKSPQLTIDRVSAMLTTNSRETWVAAKGSSEGWKEWFAKRNIVHLNKGEATK